MGNEAVCSGFIITLTGCIFNIYKANGMSKDVKIDPELKALIPKPSDDERRVLEEKLVAEGCTEKLIGWGNDPDNAGGVTLIDGHTRRDICERLGIGYSVRAMDFPGRDEVKLWMYRNQSGRRNYTDDQRAAFAFKAAELAGEIAKRERAQKGRAVGGAATPEQAEKRLEAQLTTKRSEPASKPKERARTSAAKAAKVSESKVRGVAEINKKSPELVEKIAAGEVSIRDAKQKVKEKPPEPAPDPDAPPWSAFNETVDGFISELRSTALRLGKALEYDAKVKRLRHPYAHFYTHAGTVGAINAIARTLEQNQPADVAAEHPGYLPARVVKARESVAAGN